MVGPRRGIGLTGILGGLVSSTAVTLTMSERSKHSSGLLRALAMALLLAWTIMYGRVLVEVAVVNAELLGKVALPIGIGGAVTALWAACVAFRRKDVDAADDEEHSLTNPFSIGSTIRFGLHYDVVLIGTKALSEWLVDAGLSRGDGSVSDQTAANAIGLAAAANAIVKGGLVWAIGSPQVRRLVTPAVVGAVVTSVVLTFVL